MYPYICDEVRDMLRESGVTVEAEELPGFGRTELPSYDLGPGHPAMCSECGTKIKTTQFFGPFPMVDYCRFCGRQTQPKFMEADERLDLSGAYEHEHRPLAMKIIKAGEQELTESEKEIFNPEHFCALPKDGDSDAL